MVHLPDDARFISRMQEVARGAGVMRRPAFVDAMAMLDALGPVLGGEFASARTSWAESIAGHGLTGIGRAAGTAFMVNSFHSGGAGARPRARMPPVRAGRACRAARP